MPLVSLIDVMMVVVEYGMFSLGNVDKYLCGVHSKLC